MNPFSIHDFQDRIPVSRETIERLESYADLLAQWQSRINLGGPSTLDDLWRRHMLDSAQLYGRLPAGTKTVYDLGSGAGFPGMVLAILGVSDVHLVESQRRKCTFLRQVAQATATPVTVHQDRIELLHGKIIAPVITARALAPLPRLLDLAAPLLGKSGVCLFLKGREARQELTLSQEKWRMTAEAIPSISHSEGVVLQIRDISAYHG